MNALIQFLTTDSKKSIHQASLDILEKTGISVKNKEAIEILRETGCKINYDLVMIPPDIVRKSLETLPSEFLIYSRDGNISYLVGQDNVIFNPGSSSLNIIDSETNLVRHALTRDLVDLSLIVDALEFIHFQSTALVPSDISKDISDSYRLYILLKNSNKPIITGAFRKDSLLDMVRMLEVIAGESNQLGEKPRAIFDCCPVSPLTWGDISCQNLIDCSRYNIPTEIIPAPQIGATSPITLTGTIIQTNAEFLSGVVISQLVNEGARIIYGSAPFTFDMQFCTARVGAIEAMMTACASAEMGKFYHVPSQAYLGVSDSNVLDTQSGFETAFGIILGILTKINIVSGPGMLASLNSQSLEKLVIDNEMCAAAYRLLEGISDEAISSDVDIINKVGSGRHYIGEKQTRENLTKEHLIPSSVISRLTTETWYKKGSKDTQERAKEKVRHILAHHSGTPLTFEVDNRLDITFIEILNKYGITQKEIPWGL